MARRVAEQAVVASESDAWAVHRNQHETGIDWRFTTADAGIKLKNLYPKIKL